MVQRTFGGSFVVFSHFSHFPCFLPENVGGAFFAVSITRLGPFGTRVSDRYLHATEVAIK
jgi:hypothetical protein